MSMRITDYYRNASLSVLGYERDRSPDEEDAMCFVNDFDEVQDWELVEKLNWYSGDSDRLFQFYNYAQKVENRTEPYGFKPNRAYFWAVASQDNEFKLVHSGFARDSIDTIVGICVGGKKTCSVPKVADGIAQRTIGGRAADAVLQEAMERKDVWGMVSLKQMPLTLALGWGLFKVSFDERRFGKEPLVSFYDATRSRVFSIEGEDIGYLFMDFFSDAKGTRYACAELRKRESLGTWTYAIEVYMVSGDNLNRLSEAECAERRLPYRPSTVGNMPLPLATPCSYFADPFGKLPGRSVLDGRIDILDAIDECLSIAENATRRSMPVEMFNSDFLEVDRETMMPKQPKTFERKYIMVKGAKAPDGSSGNSEPVQVTQPKLDFAQYQAQADYLKCCFLDGFLSPATFGINLAKSDSEGSQREREKQTVFTKNMLQAREKRIVESLMNQYLAAKQYLMEGRFSVLDFGVTVTFDELANASFENKLQFLSNALANNAISPEMFVDRMYGDEISEEDRKREIEWVTEKNKNPAPPTSHGDKDDEGGFGPEMDTPPVLDGVDPTE